MDVSFENLRKEAHKGKNQLCPKADTVPGSRVKQCYNLGFTDQPILSRNRNSINTTNGNKRLLKDLKTFLTATKITVFETINS